MATLYVSEFPGILPDGNGNVPQAVQMPPLAEQTVAIIGTHAESNAFDARTAIIRLISDAVCSVSVGTNPTATTSMLRIAADSPEYFKVAPGQKISVIANLGLIAEAIGILRSYGADAHVYIPGVGTISGITAGNYLDSAGTTSASVDNPVGRVVDSFGSINATQGTTANKPILRQSGGKYSWQFDGSNDSLSLSAPLFQMSDDHCVIAGAKVESMAGFQAVFSEEGTGRIQIRYEAGAVQFIWLGASTGTNFQTSETYVNTTIVIAARNSAGTKTSRINGEIKNTDSTATDTPNMTSANIGCWASSNYMFGHLYPIIAIKGTVSDSDLLTLERFVGQLSGVTGI